MSFRIVRVLALGLAFVASLASGQTNNFNVLDGSPLKATTVQVGDGTTAAPSYSFAAHPGYGLFYGTAGNGPCVTNNGVTVSCFYSGDLRIVSTNALSWASGDPSLTAADLIVARDAANTLAQRNGVNAQAVREYNSFTDINNGEWLELGFKQTANLATIQTRANGTGTERALQLGTTSSSQILIQNAVAAIRLSPAGGGWVEINSNATGLRFTTDNNSDIGAAGANRPRNIYAGSAIFTTAPNTQTGAAYTVLATDNYLIANAAATQTLTLPTASTNTGRLIRVKTIAAFTVVSASSNVVPLAGGAAGTAILAATAGKWADLVSDGTNWVIMAGN